MAECVKKANALSNMLQEQNDDSVRRVKRLSLENQELLIEKHVLK